MGKIKTIYFNSTYHSLQAFGGHHLHYQVHINTNRKLFNKLLNLQTTYPIATNRSHKKFITDVVNLK